MLGVTAVVAAAVMNVRRWSVFMESLSGPMKRSAKGEFESDWRP